MKGKQRYKCRTCKYEYTRTEPLGLPQEKHVEVIKLYSSGLSLRQSGKIAGVSHTTAIRWVKDFVEHQLPQESGPQRVNVVEMDEMWHFLEKNHRSSGSGKR